MIPGNDDADVAFKGNGAVTNTKYQHEAMQMMPVFTVDTPHLKGLRERESKQMSEMNEHRNRYAPAKKT